jgi:hypothetical protein
VSTIDFELTEQSIVAHAYLSRLTRQLVLPNFARRDISERSTSKKHNSNGQQDLHFVNFPNNLKLDVAARKRVRSHVARDFRRRAKAPSSSSLNVDLSIARRVTRDGIVGQKHRFRFGRLGLQETGKQSTRKSAVREVSSVSNDNILSNSLIKRSTNATEDPGRTDIPSAPSLHIPIVTEEFIPSLSVDTSYSSNSMWEGSDPASSQSNTSSQCCTTPRRDSDLLGSSQMVCRAKLRREHAHMQKLHLTTTGTGNLDPFNSMPIIDNSYRTQTLMHHCKHFISLTPDAPFSSL